MNDTTSFLVITVVLLAFICAVVNTVVLSLCQTPAINILDSLKFALNKLGLFEPVFRDVIIDELDDESTATTAFAVSKPA